MFGKMIKGLFGSSDEGAAGKAAPPTHYNGYEIHTVAMKAGQQWQVAGRIEKNVDGGTRVHDFIRADTMATAEDAANETIRKAKIMIDQMGDAIFK